jgi:general nucleoside transport system permease protein
MSPETLELVLISIVTAATPLVLAAIGELVVERAGVLNLGVEGMMIVGASIGFAAAYVTDSTVLGALAGIGAGLLLAAIFAVLAVFLATNQVATGLALTILGVGLSGLSGASFVGLKRDGAPPLDLPGLSHLPYVGKLVFGEDLFVYGAVCLVAGVGYFLSRTRLGLVVRAVGDNHASAHALGVPVRRVRLLAVLFGGACAGLGGAYLSLAYTPFWSPGMTAGRGWIALALVVFSSWKPWRCLAGAILFGGATTLQLHAQAFGFPVPAQFMSALPYLATIAALVILSIWDRRGTAAPAALGQPFVPDR